MQVSIGVVLSSICFVISTGAITDEEISKRLEILSRVKRVIGGNETNTGDWPWLVHLTAKIPKHWHSFFSRQYRYHYCGGALIAPRLVLTAAHCFDGDDKTKTPKYWHVKAGDHEAHTHFLDRPKTFLGRLFGRGDWITYTSHAEVIRLHPEYASGPDELWNYDAAIIQTEDEFPVNDANVPQIAALKMPPDDAGSDWPANGQPCVVKGWGCTSDGAPTEDVARAVVLPKVPDSSCRNDYGGSTTARFCAGYNFKNKGICSGDSGGPLVCMYDGDWAHAGIASFSASGASGDHPAAFTRITEIIPFIKDYTGKK